MEQVVDTRSGREIADAHPFLEWYGRMSDHLTIRNRDVVLDRSLSAQFVLGVEGRGVLVLGLNADDAPYLLSLHWVRSGMKWGHKGGDWLCLTSDDVNESGKPIRVFIPVASHLSKRIREFEADRLLLRRVKMVKGRPALARGRPQADIPLVMGDF